MLDNFEQISDLLNFDSEESDILGNKLKDEDTFYFAQILKRRKDKGNEGMKKGVIVVKNYYITSLEHFDKIQPEMKSLCNTLNSRAYIRLNKRSFKKTALQNIKLLIENIINEAYHSAKNLYDSACGKTPADKNKTWVVDLDTVDMSESYNGQIDVWGLDINGFINSLEPMGPKLVSIIETKNGMHLITKPFNLKKFKDEKKYSMVDVHKDGMTILYIGEDKWLN